MNSGVPPKHESPLGDCLAGIRRRPTRAGGHTSRVGLLLLALISMLVFASSALGSTGTVRPGWAERGSSHYTSGCTGHGGDGKVPPVVPPVVPSPPVGRGGSEIGGEAGGRGGASTETTTSNVATPAITVAVPVAAPGATVPLPVAPKSTLKQPLRKSTLKRPARKAAKKRAKKHHSRADGASNERTLARSALPNKRAAFTG
jgi:hypothetical protein